MLDRISLGDWRQTFSKVCQQKRMYISCDYPLGKWLIKSTITEEAFQYKWDVIVSDTTGQVSTLDVLQ